MSIHQCPGGCSRRISNERFACRSCWYRLPCYLRNLITQAYRRGTHHADNMPMAKATIWHKHHPRTGRVEDRYLHEAISHV